MTSQKGSFQLGDSVRFKDGQRDEESGIDIGGWQGRITEIDEKSKILLVELDSITLQSMPREYIERCEEMGFGWSEYYIGFDDVEAAEPRDKKSDVKATIAELENLVAWVHLGEKGREINAILAGADNEDEQLDVWEKYLQNTLSFPFEAEVSEWQDPRSPLQVGQKVRVMDIDELDEWYGILVKVKKGRRQYIFPLCDLEVTSANSPNHDPVHLYSVWFANK